MQTVLLNYDLRERPTTTAYYLEGAIERLGYKLVFDGEADISLNVEPLKSARSLSQSIVRAPKTIYWELDSYRHKGQNKPLYDVDLVAISSSPLDLPHYPNALWVPMAADPSIHNRQDVPQDYDLVFVGRADSVYPERCRLLELIQKYFNVLVTTSPPGAAYSIFQSSGKLIFNRSCEHEINMRFFESMAIGTQITNRLPGMETLAEEGKHYIGYTSDEELLEQINKYLKDNDAREYIAEESRKLILDRHTYDHRIKTLLNA